MPRRRRTAYTHQLDGHFGRFGMAAGVQPFYLLSAMRPVQLTERVSLISEIPGSERWPIRELFQRDVDSDRVSTALLPYLRNTGNVKFFSPLVLTLLPVSADSKQVQQLMPRLKRTDSDEEGTPWRALERPNHYRIAWNRDRHDEACLQWNSSRVRLVAIDGQHRLAALKQRTDDRGADGYKAFLRWRIPVVVVSYQADTTGDLPTVLNVVRSTFVNINTTAKPVSRSRSILLSDGSVNAICTQELLQRSHDADNRDDSSRSTRLPLLFFDWRGEEKGGKPVPSQVAVTGVDEVHDWFERYILGEDLSEQQEDALQRILTDELRAAFRDRRKTSKDDHHNVLTHLESNALRDRIHQEHFLDAVAHVLEGFTPFNKYTTDVRSLERDLRNDPAGNLARHAFDLLRYGTPAPLHIARDVEEQKVRLEATLLELRTFPRPLSHDVGKRGIVWAFGELRRALGRPPWRTFARWFTKALNRAYTAGALDLQDDESRRRLTHIVVNERGTIINYRLRDSESAFGAYVALMVGAFGGLDRAADLAVKNGALVAVPEMKPLKEKDGITPKILEGWRAKQKMWLKKIRQTLARGYRKEIFPDLKKRFPQGGTLLNEAATKQAGRLAKKHVAELEDHLAAVATAPSPVI